MELSIIKLNTIQIPLKVSIFNTLFSNKKVLFQRMFIGALIGFGFISLFVFSVKEPDPSWGPYWQIRPLIIATLAGAVGMLSFYLQDIIKPKGEMSATFLIAGEIVLFGIAIWLGIVLGLDGTMWD